MKLSVITTLYKSETFIEEFYRRLISCIIDFTDDYEIIFVDDGSPDNSNKKILELKGIDDNIKLIELSRNFGHHYAIQAGMFEAKGDLIYLIDCDLETAPEIFKELYIRFENQNDLDVVYAFQENRKGDWFEKISGNLFYKLLNLLSETEIPKNILTERIMTRKYVNSLLQLGDSNLFLGGMMYWVGFNQLGIPVQKKQRKGKSTYTLRKRLSLLINAVASFSGKPLTWLFNFGIIISFLSMFSGFVITVSKLYYGSQIQVGWTSLLLVNILILGIISTFLGIVGIYLYKIFNQVQRRPNFIIKKKYE